MTLTTANTVGQWFSDYLVFGALSNQQANATYLKKTEANTTYLKKLEANTVFLKKAEANTTYLKKLEANTVFLKKAEANTTYLKKLEANTTYLKKTEANTTYLKRNGGVAVSISLTNLTPATANAVVTKSWVGANFGSNTYLTSNYLPITNPSALNSITISNATSSGVVRITAPANQYSGVQFVDTQLRWLIGRSATSADFFFNYYDSSGSFVRTPITVAAASGNITFSGTATAPDFDVSSDRNLKENIKPLYYNSYQFDQLEPAQYNFKSDDSKKLKFGFIAQEVEKLFPNIVGTDVNDNKTLTYDMFIAILVKEVQLLKKEIEELKKR